MYTRRSRRFGSGRHRHYERSLDAGGVMTRNIRIPIAVGLLCASAVACAEPKFNAAFSGLADDENGRSLDIDTTLAASDWLTLGAGLGSTSSRTASGTLDGTSVRLCADVHSERFGVRGYYRKWNANGMDTGMLGVRPYFTHDNLTLSVIGESRGLDVDYVTDTSNPQRATAHFSGFGWGAGASYRWSHWNVYAEGVAYQYGTLSRYVATSPVQTGNSSVPTPLKGVGLPTLPSPGGDVGSGLVQALGYRVPALAGSYVTLNQGVFDHVVGAGVERGFARASLRLDWTGVKDAVLETDLNSFSASYRYVFTPRLTAGVTLGVTESRYGSVDFGGLAFGITL